MIKNQAYYELYDNIKWWDSYKLKLFFHSITLYILAKVLVENSNFWKNILLSDNGKIKAHSN